MFIETVYKISKEMGKPLWYRGSGNMATYDLHLFYFHLTIKILQHSSFNSSRSTFSFYWCYIFSFEYLCSKNINTEGKNACHFLVIDEHKKKKI